MCEDGAEAEAVVAKMKNSTPTTVSVLMQKVFSDLQRSVEQLGAPWCLQHAVQVRGSEVKVPFSGEHREPQVLMPSPAPPP